MDGPPVPSACGPSASPGVAGHYTWKRCSLDGGSGASHILQGVVIPLRRALVQAIPCRVGCAPVAEPRSYATLTPGWVCALNRCGPYLIYSLPFISRSGSVRRLRSILWIAQHPVDRAASLLRTTQIAHDRPLAARRCRRVVCNWCYACALLVSVLQLSLDPTSQVLRLAM